MFTLERDADTICAIATPVGSGAIAIVRLSGEQSAEIIHKIAPFLPMVPESHRIYYGYIIDPRSGNQVDEVLVSYFACGRSFTGEASFEISCHGSSAVTQQIVSALINAGARLAQKGEFTYRAFNNGRIDLLQAEGVLSVIESHSALGSRMALRQLKGELSHRLIEIEEALIWCLSRLEANLDFSSEFIEFAAIDEILQRANGALDKIKQLLNTYSKGRLLRDGLRVALVGAPNVGKSSLLNTLVGQDRVIVSPIAGTTRDVIEIESSFNGQAVVFVDTAGLRSTQDQIEAMGVAKTIQTIADADLICYISDVTREETLPLPKELIGCNKTVIHILNKSDLVGELKASDGQILLSAKSGHGMEQFKSAISSQGFQQHEQNSVVLLNARHFELLSRAEKNLTKGIELILADASAEFIISEIQETLFACLEMLGKQYNDEVLDRVFRDFCLGK